MAATGNEADAAAEADHAPPRAITDAESAALLLAAQYLVEGPASWWSALAEDSELRALGREAALAEIGVRAGPATGASWTLQTPGPGYAEGIAIFTIEFPSGLDETLRLDFSREANSWRLESLTILADPHVVDAAFERLFEREDEDAAVAPLPSQRPPGALLLSLLVVAALAVASVQARAARRPLAAAAVCAVAAVLACRESPPAAEAPAAVAEEAPFVELRALLPLREALAGSGADPEALLAAAAPAGVPGEVRRLWEAAYRLSQLRVQDAATILEEFADDAPYPLADLLRARLAFLRSDRKGTARGYDRALVRSTDHDGLRIEALQAYALLGHEGAAESELADLGRLGSRLADAHYGLARLAAINGDGVAGERHLVAAFGLQPLPRRELLSDPFLAPLCGRPTLTQRLSFTSSAEPLVRPAAAPSPAAWPPGITLARTTGELLELAWGEARLIVPGGARLAPADAEVLDAVTRERRDEEAALARLSQITAAAKASATMARPVRRRETELAASALAARERWTDLVALTEETAARVEVAPPLLVKLRALALDELDRGADARALLLGLAASDAANRRRDPGTLFQLAHVLADEGEFEPALKLMRRVAQIAPHRGAEEEVRRFELEQRLASSWSRQPVGSFDLVFPQNSAASGMARELGSTLEAERQRLQRWIPGSGGRVEIHFFPIEDFYGAFGASSMVIGLYDGKVRLPFAQFKELPDDLLDVVTHELAHAMIDGRTHDRAPKWLHEGLAQSVERFSQIPNPLRERSNTVGGLSLVVLEDVLDGFADADYVSHAYRQAAWTMRFVEARWGVAGVHRLLDAAASGLETPALVKRALGLDVASFDRELAAWGEREPQTWERYDERPAPRATATDAADTTVALVGVAGEARQKVEANESLAGRMAAWHPRYLTAIAPVKRALGPVVAIMRRNAQDDLGARCTELFHASVSVRESPELGAAPTPTLATALVDANDHVLKLTTACRAGHDREMHLELSALEQAMGRAARELAPFGLKP